MSTPITSPKITHVVLGYGYVESAIMAPMIFTATDGYFESPRAALENLAASWFMKYLEDFELSEGWEKEEKACCLANKAKKKKSKFCDVCGTRLAKIAHIDFEGYCDWLSSMCAHTIDGFGEDLPGWDLYGGVKSVMMNATPDQVVEIPDQAEKLLARLLTPELVPAKFQDNIREWQEENKEHWQTVEMLMHEQD